MHDIHAVEYDIVQKSADNAYREPGVSKYREVQKRHGASFFNDEKQYQGDDGHSNSGKYPRVSGAPDLKLVDGIKERNDAQHEENRTECVDSLAFLNGSFREAAEAKEKCDESDRDVDPEDVVPAGKGEDESSECRPHKRSEGYCRSGASECASALAGREYARDDALIVGHEQNNKQRRSVGASDEVQ